MSRKAQMLLENIEGLRSGRGNALMNRIMQANVAILARALLDPNR